MNFNRPDRTTTALVLIDMQDRLVKAMDRAEAVMNRQELLLRAAAVLALPVVVTEQYPQGLGPTAENLLTLLPPGTPVIAKTSFSCFGVPAFVQALRERGCRTVILAGCEAHVCVQQTMLEAVAQGFQVILAADAITSRFAYNIEWALALGREAGAVVMSAEAAIFWLVGDAAAPEFRTLSKLVR